MSPTLASRADIALGVLGLALVAAATWAIVLCVRGSWSRARAVASRTFWSSVFVQFLASFAIPIAVVRHACDPATTDEVSPKARMLAEAISDGMNLTAPLFLVTPAALGVWGLAVWRVRRARQGTAG